ncbi:alanine/glycine:cation symporter family protein [Clostridium cadaveris]|mgnify:CR=1 FL=1|uniref:Alanine or glycine:cation symporter, AGCS family n=1 Tax=Clostridium cadaveris TaxID=1529 RepID=A0A1I2QCF6_9CLOT|nr:amino acid carrier protein [Clostridium cadaveris]MDM8313595.1 amino acid carrier protein [Clostridium cadaveris]MDY4950463.1 amino acid carrier protein [Clostridium cadaveris]NME66298.1 sodium:alanine symporter family protein [Clostridium cadaveris]NWK12096.1 sodium:alanine symporter family protein [Clostridium cadaveris]PWL52101.1 MAG: sodium:alanine symporter family protein [Clostridium cadaveris]
MENLENVLALINSWIWGKWLVFVLLGLGVLYTFTNGFIQVKHFRFIMKKTLIDSFKSRNSEKGEGSISSFKAMMVTLAGNVGGGNVVGVATAIVAGGLGSIFWMWFAAFFGMALKYGEIVLSQLYRGKDSEGNLLSGPMYYIRDGLHMPWLGVVIAVLMCVKMMGANLVQSNTISGILNSNYGIPTWLTGSLLIVFLMTITLGGLKRVANIATALVPIMSIFYIVVGLLVIILNIQNVPSVFATIFREAFSFKAAAGGTGGFIIARAMQFGITRGMYSNEAGEGTAPFAHGSTIVSHPVEEGITGVTEVFLDTIVVCTITALVVGVTGAYTSGTPATVMAIEAFGTVWAPLKHAATLALLIFCFTTLMGQWFNAAKSFTYAFGPKVTSVCRFIFPFLCIIGAITKISLVWTIQDLAMGLVVIPNMIALIVLFPQVRKQTQDYFSKNKELINK